MVDSRFWGSERGKYNDLEQEVSASLTSAGYHQMHVKQTMEAWMCTRLPIERAPSYALIIDLSRFVRATYSSGNGGMGHPPPHIPKLKPRATWPYLLNPHSIFSTADLLACFKLDRACVSTLPHEKLNTAIAGLYVFLRVHFKTEYACRIA
jgi:hypothetical protein